MIEDHHIVCGFIGPAMDSETEVAVAETDVLPTVPATRPKGFLVPVVFEKEDEPPAKLARGACVRHPSSA